MDKVPVLGFVLLNDVSFDCEKFRRLFKNDWSTDLNITTKGNHIIFNVDNVTFTCSHIPGIFPERDLEKHSKHNYLWPEALQHVNTHKSFIVIAVMNGSWEVRSDACICFSMVAASMCALDNAIGVYIGGASLVISKENYRKPIKIMNKARDNQEKYFPVEHWVFVGIYKTEMGCSGYTCGMGDFGNHEFEIINSSMEVDRIYVLLNNIAYATIVSRVKFKARDKIRAEHNSFINVELSRGIRVEGESLKVIV